MSGVGALVLDTLCMAESLTFSNELRTRWHETSATRSARAIATWAAWEGAELWLGTRLGELAVDPPRDLAEPLRVAARRAAQAHLAIEGDALRVLELLHRADVPVMLIKGLARRVALPPRLQPTRATSDVDLIVPLPAAPVAWHALRGAGYQPLPVPGGERPEDMLCDSAHHLRPLMRAGGAAIEIHVSTSRHVDPDTAWDRLNANRRDMNWNGATVSVPSATEMAWHAFTHAKLYTPEAWRLWFWLDAAATIAQGDIDWALFTRRVGAPDAPESLQGLRWLGAAASLAGATLPGALAAPHPYPLADMLDWRVGAFHGGLGAALLDKLVDEAARVEAGLGLVPLVEGRTLPVHIRRRIASLAARAAYAVWRSRR